MPLLTNADYAWVKTLSDDEQTNRRTQMSAWSKRRGAVDSCLLNLLHQRTEHIWRVVPFAQGTLLQGQSGVAVGNVTEAAQSPRRVTHIITSASHRDIANLECQHKTQEWTLILSVILQPASHRAVSTGAMCWALNWLLAQCECMILTSFVENGAASM